MTHAIFQSQVVLYVRIYFNLLIYLGQLATTDKYQQVCKVSTLLLHIPVHEYPHNWIFQKMCLLMAIFMVFLSTVWQCMSTAHIPILYVRTYVTLSLGHCIDILLLHKQSCGECLYTYGHCLNNASLMTVEDTIHVQVWKCVDKYNNSMTMCEHCSPTNCCNKIVKAIMMDEH